jgi:hypothetical protein
MLYLNYTSGVSTQGIGAHKCTRVHLLGAWDALATGSRAFTAVAPVIPETNFWVDAIGYALTYWDANSGSSQFFAAEVKSGEAQGDGWRYLWSGVATKDTEIGQYNMNVDGSREFPRFTADPDTTRLPIEATRIYRLESLNTWGGIGGVIYLTYHAITFTVGGDITGSAGGSVSIDAHRTDTDEQIGSTSRTGNGAYTITWYDNTITCYADAREDGTHIGRSNNLTPTGSA